MNVTSGGRSNPAMASLDRLHERLDAITAPIDMRSRAIFLRRLDTQYPRIMRLLQQLYGHLPRFDHHLERILSIAARSFADRPADLKRLDVKREQDPLWFQNENIVGAVCYVDRFANNLAGLHEHLGYIESLGITYLHLMPLFDCPATHNDGGYAVSSFRKVKRELGTMDELAALARTMRERGISLVLDFVFNHTSDEHEWAVRALNSQDPEQARYQAYYRMFDTRELPDQYERNLREIFPEQAPGSFLWREDIRKWVWTTFFDFQWDLNYANPDVFCAMLEEMLFLANQGVDVLRLDAVPFIWKQIGTNCENLPEAHILIEAYNALVKVAAPAMLFKSEAIVHPRDVMSYIGWNECQLSYNPIMMVCLWDAFATRDVRLLQHTMQKRFALPPDCAWINYIRSHDDIGWGFADEDAGEIGVNAFDHRFFLNQFYTGRFPGSFAAGLPFNYNPRTQDMRISGTTASLIGLERALHYADAQQVEHALRRILFAQAVVISAGGIPLIYLGDELATLNDYTFKDDDGRASDSRWVHRPEHDWARSDRRHDPTTIEGRVFHGLRRLIRLRKALPVMANGQTQWLDPINPHILAFTRQYRLLVVGNVSDFETNMSLFDAVPSMAPDGLWQDIITGREIDGRSVTLQPYEIMWLLPRREKKLLSALEKIDARM